MCRSVLRWLCCGAFCCSALILWTLVTKPENRSKTGFVISVGMSVRHAWGRLSNHTFTEAMALRTSSHQQQHHQTWWDIRGRCSFNFFASWVSQRSGGFWTTKKKVRLMLVCVCVCVCVKQRCGFPRATVNHFRVFGFTTREACVSHYEKRSLWRDTLVYATTPRHQKRCLWKNVFCISVR